MTYAGYGRYGAGVYLSSGFLTIANCIVSRNTANNATAYGGGIGVGGGALTARNSLLFGNDMMSGGDGVYVSGGSASLENCTIVTNFGQGIYRAGGTAAVTNSIVWLNGQDVTGTVALAWSDVGVWDAAATRANCLSTDPSFKVAATNDYRLMPGSPCINAGTNLSWMTNAIDLAGGPRIRNRMVDVGAYETVVPPVGSVFLLR